MENKINIQKIVESWTPAVQQLTKGAVNEQSDRMEWICQLAHNQKMHALYEGAEAVGGVTSPLSTLNNTVGIGNAVPASQAGMTAAEQSSKAVQGSGDKWPVFLPMAVQVAARTIGFDLVNVTPMDGPTGVIPFLDYVYSDGKEPYGATPAYSSATANPARGWKQGESEHSWSQFGAPAAFKAIMTITDPSLGTKRDVAKTLREAGNITLTGNGKSVVVEFIALSRLSADPMFKVVDASTATIGEVFAGDIEVTVVTGVKVKRPRLISMLEDQILGYTGAGKYDTDKWSGTFQNPFKLYEPMDRATGEQQMPRHLSLEVRTQFVQVGKIQTAVSVTREQVQDLQKQWGIDVLKMVENAAINELSQTINKHILSRLFALGWKNHMKAYEAEGLNLNLSFGAATTIGFATYDNGVEITPAQAQMTVPAMTVYGDFENQDTKNARVARLIKTAGNVIMQRGRRGPATFVVTNYKVASMLQDQAQYTFAPLANTFNQNNGQLYPLGTVAGMTVYVDPYMRYDDTRVLVGRKGEKDEPGVHFCPYLMAESVNFINPATMSPKVVVSSRYALVDVGWYPETQFLTLFINTPENLY